MGYSYIYIEEEGTEEIFPEDILSEETRYNTLLAVSMFYEKAKSIVAELVQQSGDPLDLLQARNLNIVPPPSASLRESVRNIVEDLFIIGSVGRYETNLGIPRTNAIHNHVLNVAIISLLIGWQYNFSDSEQIALGMGALLHDVGKLALPDIYEKQWKELSPDERTRMKDHPLLGEKLLKGSRTITEAERQIVIQHHERQNGTGYPFSLHGINQKPVKTRRPEPNQIFRFAEIVAVADAYDNLVSGSFNRRCFSPKKALNELAKEAGTRLNSDIVSVMFSIVTVYPIGSNVKIVKHFDSRLVGTKGVVVKSIGEDSDEVEIVVLFNKQGRRVPARKFKISLNKGKAVELAPC